MIEEETFVDKVYILENLKRWSTIHTIRQESVASHSFFVAAIVLDLASKYRFDVKDAVAMAICHDMTELELTDIPRNIKHRYPGIREAFRECEDDVIKTFPKAIRNIIKTYNTGYTVECKIVHLADTMQCMQFARQELKLGNKGYMSEVYAGSLTRIFDLEQGLLDHVRP